MKLKFKDYELIAKARNAIIEREIPKPNNGFSRYSITYNSRGETVLCKNLNEVSEEFRPHLRG